MLYSRNSNHVVRRSLPVCLCVCLSVCLSVCRYCWRHLYLDLCVNVLICLYLSVRMYICAEHALCTTLWQPQPIISIRTTTCLRQKLANALFLVTDCHWHLTRWYQGRNWWRVTRNAPHFVNNHRLTSCHRAQAGNHNTQKWCRVSKLWQWYTVAVLHQGAPDQMTWLEDPPPWLKPCVLLCFGNNGKRK